MSNSFMSDSMPAITGIGVGDLPATQGSTMVQTMNTNMGAVRVQVKRNLPEVLKEIEQHAEVFGDTWEYALPFRRFDKETEKWITDYVTGPTVKCVQDVCRIYGNCSLGVTRVDDEADAWWIYSTFLDVQSGYQYTRAYRQRKDQKTGMEKKDPGRHQDMLFQVGVSKSLRNAGNNALAGLVERGLEFMRKRIIGRIEQNPEGCKNWIVENLGHFDIPLKQVETFFREKLNDMPAKRLAVVVRTIQGMIDGQTLPSEAFKIEIIEGEVEEVERKPETKTEPAANDESSTETAKTETAKAESSTDEAKTEPGKPKGNRKAAKGQRSGRSGTQQQKDEKPAPETAEETNRQAIEKQRLAEARKNADKKLTLDGVKADDKPAEHKLAEKLAAQQAEAKATRTVEIPADTGDDDLFDE